MAGEGRKFDTGKLRFDLIPACCEKEIAKVLSYGAAKYEANNWQNVEPFNDRYYAAIRRHLNAWRIGEKVDPESGLRHLSHIATNAFFLLWGEINEKS